MALLLFNTHQVLQSSWPLSAIYERWPITLNQEMNVLSLNCKHSNRKNRQSWGEIEEAAGFGMVHALTPLSARYCKIAHSGILKRENMQQGRRLWKKPLHSKVARDQQLGNVKCIQNIFVSYSMASVLLTCGSPSAPSLTGDPDNTKENPRNSWNPPHFVGGKISYQFLQDLLSPDIFLFILLDILSSNSREEKTQKLKGCVAVTPPRTAV